MKWYLAALKKYAIFNGRSRRTEYWMFVVFNLLTAAGLTALETLSGIFGLSLIYALAVIVPGLAVTVRRLHDTDRSGWWLLISLIPVLGIIVLLLFLVLDSTPGRNRFGPNPKELGAEIA